MCGKTKKYVVNNIEIKLREEVGNVVWTGLYWLRIGTGGRLL
jgi:hypothetical protein